MEQDKKAWARELLTKYIEENNCRKTAERFAILDTIYEFEGYFTLENLTCRMTEQNFRVSRATIYNSLRLFLKLCLVVKHRFQSQVVYESCKEMTNRCYQICIACGKMTEIDIPTVAQAIASVRLRRFRKEYYSVNIYGVCSSCQKRSKRKKNITEPKKSNN